jgi:carbon-monoxide dehydrogenase medium subunit
MCLAGRDRERSQALQEFAYERPLTLGEAVAAMQAGEARPLAGGTDLIAQLREGRRRAQRIVDLKLVPELAAISAHPDGGVSIGAAASATAVARHALVASRYPAVASSARLIGSLQIQNRASLGGNICNAAPSADAVPALICHRARVAIAGPGGRREMDLEALFEGPGRTALAGGEILAAILLPAPPPRSAGCYLRFTPRREMDIAVAGAGVWIELGDSGAIAAARVALASVAPTPIRAPAAEARLVGEMPSPALFAEAGRLAARDARPISDTRGSADYRRSLVAVLTERALADCSRALGMGAARP